MFDNYIFSQINNLAGKCLWLDALAIFCAKYLPYLLIAFLFLLLLKDFKKNKNLILIGFLTAGLSRIVVEIIRLFYFQAASIPGLLRCGCRKPVGVMCPVR